MSSIILKGIRSVFAGINPLHAAAVVVAPLAATVGTVAAVRSGIFSGGSVNASDAGSAVYVTSADGSLGGQALHGVLVGLAGQGGSGSDAASALVAGSNGSFLALVCIIGVGASVLFGGMYLFERFRGRRA